MSYIELCNKTDRSLGSFSFQIRLKNGKVGSCFHRWQWKCNKIMQFFQFKHTHLVSHIIDFLCPCDNSQGALRFAPVCPSVCLSVCPSICAFMHCRVWSLCTQLLLQFSMDHFETMHTCCGYIEDVHVTFCRGKNHF